MLKKVNRGLKRSDFENSRVNGRMYQSPLFAVSIINNQETITKKQTTANDQLQNNQTKIGFVISKKISKRAVDRNRIKRLISEVIKKDIEETKNLKLKHQKLIFLVRKDILEASREEIEKCWKEINQKINEQR